MRQLRLIMRGRPEMEPHEGRLSDARATSWCIRLGPVELPTNVMPPTERWLAAALQQENL